jgi:hypothetical protein
MELERGLCSHKRVSPTAFENPLLKVLAALKNSFVTALGFQENQQKILSFFVEAVVN